MSLRSCFRTHNLHRKLLHVAHVMGPTLIALAFAGAANVAHAQGTISFSGAQTFMQTVQTFAEYAGAVMCLRRIAGSHRRERVLHRRGERLVGEEG